MTAPALSTHGVDKSFGSLVVAKGISLTLPQGERYALIGPNGAGKTTLINLMTGLLTPDARVKRGLVRTFQINTLFPNLTPLESVMLVIAERRGDAGVWWKGLPSYKDDADEAYSILNSLKLGGVAYRDTRELAYGQQRLLEIALALATKPKVLLLD